MAFVVETGAGLPDATSYASEDAADTYFEDRGNTTWLDSTDDKEAALIRATSAIDARYRGRWPGYRTNMRDQALEWPRTAAYDAEDTLIDADEVPYEVINAVCEAAMRELASPGSMMPDLERGGGIKRLKAGSVEVEYAGNAAAETTFSIIDGILAGLLGARQASFVGRAVRG